MIQVFIGYDPREAIAFSVLAYSIQVRSSVPVAITPIMLSQLKGVLTRERHPLQSTDFSFSRFLTPYLSGFTGWSIFMDGDMLVLDDIAKLHALRDDRYAVMVRLPGEGYLNKEFYDVPLAGVKSEDFITTEGADCFLVAYKFALDENKHLMVTRYAHPYGKSYLDELPVTITTYRLQEGGITDGKPPFYLHPSQGYPQKITAPR